jgi:single-strand DNA-binding protein
MANGLNRWMGVGNLAADPELRVTHGGQAVLKLRLACSESYLDRNNARQERTEFVTLTVWGKRAEALAKILTKGASIYAEGSLRTSSYEKDGEKRYRTEIAVTEILLVGGKGGGRPEGGAERSSAEGVAAPRGRRAEFGPNAYEPPDPGGDDDIPF